MTKDKVNQFVHQGRQLAHEIMQRECLASNDHESLHFNMAKIQVMATNILALLIWNQVKEHGGCVQDAMLKVSQTVGIELRDLDEQYKEGNLIKQPVVGTGTAQ